MQIERLEVGIYLQSIKKQNFILYLLNGEVIDINKDLFLKVFFHSICTVLSEERI